MHSSARGAAARALQRRPSMTLLKHLLAIVPFAVGVFAGCTTTVPEAPDLDEEAEGESAQALTSCHTERPGICVNAPINAAVECAKRHGAVVLSYYRGPTEQRCVRHQNGCTDPCTGLAGCNPIAANCGTSNHTRCLSVDFHNDGHPATQAQLAACGLGRRPGQRPHANHYDYMPGGTAASAPSPAPSTSSSSGKAPSGASTTPPPSGKVPSGGSSGATCASATLGQSVAAGACVQRADDDSWYVCDASDPSAWPMVDGALDPRCTSCPQLPGEQCDDSGSGSGK
jgi:hypothetical protein